METFPKLERIRRLTLTPGMKLVCMSDMHRGDGSGADDFAQNSLIYRSALEHYLESGFTYVELGDAEELWENDNFDQIYITHTMVYELLAKFHDPDPEKSRYLKVWGNHDLYWQDNEVVYRTLFPGIEIHEAIILETGSNQSVGEGGGGAILLIHGHQADPKCCGEMAVVSKFFVHNFWPDLQRVGIKDPTRAALNPGLCNEVDKRLHEWANNNDQGVAAIIAGHTHRAVFENLSLTEQRYLESKIRTDGVSFKHQPDRSYFNTGSCVHPLCITGIEITFENGPLLRLVKWGQATNGHALTIQRTVLEET
jgi:predicted phosphodiesterase